MQEIIQETADQILNGSPLSQEKVLALAGMSAEDLPGLMAAARKVRETFRGDKVSLCAIINAKSGRCAEDCSFCAQSVRYATGVKSYPLIPDHEVLDRAEKSAEDGASFFCIVTSGRRATAAEITRICGVLTKIRHAGKVMPCASLGTLDLEDLKKLRQAGLVRYHHNVETARSFYESVCTTHSYDRRVQTVLNAGKAGLQVCSGGILGMGETMEQRMEMALTLRDLHVDSIPLNFLNPIPGTPLEKATALGRVETLKTVALFRLIHPAIEIRACAGREAHLGEDQGALLEAGVDGILTGDYLTTRGTLPQRDIEMITAHGFKV